jgi:hypothetical protein
MMGTPSKITISPATQQKREKRQDKQQKKE